MSLGASVAHLTNSGRWTSSKWRSCSSSTVACLRSLSHTVQFPRVLQIACERSGLVQIDEVHRTAQGVSRLAHRSKETGRWEAGDGDVHIGGGGGPPPRRGG